MVVQDDEGKQDVARSFREGERQTRRRDRERKAYVHNGITGRTRRKATMRIGVWKDMQESKSTMWRDDDQT